MTEPTTAAALCRWHGTPMRYPDPRDPDYCYCPTCVADTADEISQRGLGGYA